MRGRLVSLIAAPMALGLVFTLPAGADEDAPVRDVSVQEARFVNLINNERFNAGLNALVVVPELVAVGREWSGAMLAQSSGSESCHISHNPALASEVVANWRRLGENVGCGNVDADYLHQMFVASPAHLQNILDPTFDSVGIGIVFDGDVMFVTEQFMDLQDPRSRSVPAVLTMSTRAAAKLARAARRRRV